MQRKTQAIVFASILFFLCAQNLFALPQGEVVENGTATFEKPNETTLNITASDKAVINFNSFNIAQNEVVNFIQPNTDSALLSRVVGNGPSEIFGTLNANGTLFLVNPRGIHFAQTAQINVGSLVASTLDISTCNFLNGSYIFEQNSSLSPAQIVNNGNINSQNNIAILAGSVKNVGVITARAGTVNLASGSKTTVVIDRRGLIQVEINEQMQNQVFDLEGNSVKDAIVNSGEIQAKQVVMSVKTAENIFENAVNQTGIVKANKVIVGDDNVIRIIASTNIEVSGRLEAAEGQIAIEVEDVKVVDKLNTKGNTTISVNNDVDVEADIVTENGNLSLLSDNDFDGIGTFRQSANTTISTVNFGDITIQASGEATLANIYAAGDLILRQGGSLAIFNQTQDSHILVLGSIYIEEAVALNAKNTVYEIGRNWVNLGNFNPEQSLVRFVSQNVSEIFGINTFYNFSVVAPGKTVIFPDNSTQTILGSLVLQGGYGNLLTLTSRGPPNQFQILPLSEVDIQYCLIGNSNNIRGPPLQTLHSDSLGNNTNWQIDIIWTGNSDTPNWSNSNNWDTGTIPQQNSNVLFSSLSSQNSIIDENFSGTINRLIIDGYLGNLILGRDLALRGDFSTHGSSNFNPQNFSVIFTDASQISNISGNNTFYNFTCVTPNKVIKFNVGNTQTVLGTWLIQGDYAMHVRLVSTELGRQWLVDPKGERVLSYVWVEDSYNLHPVEIPMTESTNRNNNFNWDATGTWTNGSGDGKWSTVGNWSGLGGAQPGAGDDVVFNGTSNTASNVDVDFAGTVGSIALNSGYTQTVTLQRTLATSTASGRTGNVTINSGIISQGVNDFTIAGALSVGGGTLNISSALTNITGALTLTSGTISGTTGTITAASYAVQSGTISAILAGAGITLTKSTAGTVTLSAANTYTGLTTVSAGSLTYGIDNAIASGDVTVNSGTLNLAGYSDTIGALTEDSGTITISTGTLTLGGALTMTKGSISSTGAGKIVLGSDVIVNGSNGGATISSNVELTADCTFNVGWAMGTYGLTVSGVVSGNFGIIKSGSGYLYISGANTYTGLTTLSAGAISISNAAALGTGDNGTVVNAGYLALSGGITIAAEALTLNDGGATYGSLYSSGNNAWQGAITLGSASRINSDGGTLTLSGGITGNTFGLTIGGGGGTTISNVIATTTGTLTKDGAGTLTLSAANTYTGTTTINAGVLNIQNALALGTADNGTTVVYGAALEMQGGITVTAEALILNGTGISAGGGLRNRSGDNEWQPSITLGDSSRINSDSGTLTISGGITGDGRVLIVGGAGNTTISSVIATTTGTLTKDGAGTLTLNAANTYTGLTTVSAGSLTYGIDNAISSGNVTVSGGTLNISTYTDTVGTVTLSSSGIITGTTGVLTSTAAYAMQSGTVSAILAGAVALNKTTTGTVTISSANTYTGLTTVSAGVLNIQNALALGTADNGTSITAGAALEIQGGIIVTAEALTLNSTGVSAGGALRNKSDDNEWQPSIALGSASRINSDSGTLAISGGITGNTYGLTVGGAGNTTISSVIATTTGTLTKDGAGTVTLSGVNTYTGATTINAGTLSVATIANGGVACNIGAATTAAGNLVLGGGTLQYTGVTASTDRNYTLTAATTSTIEIPDSVTFTISGASTNTTGALTKTGAGTLKLSGANLYTGTTTVSAGTLQYGANNALSSGAVAVSGGTLDLVTYTDTVGAVTLSSGSITSTTGILTGTSYAVQSGSISAILAGAVALTKTTAGTVTLSGVNTYTGATTINAGTLSVATIANGGVACNIGAATT
ncbi:MAG: autotransporter-associated beta strand repeat-containing protein, partial [Candidatus Omnitrophota bacterium]